MRLTILMVVALFAASAASAREPKKKPEAPPPPPVQYELDDPQFGEALAEACLASPPEIEIYDSRDDVMIAKTSDGAHAFFHLKGGCDTNTMIFADSVVPESGAECVGVGESLVFTSSYGESKKCIVERITRWLDDELISPEYEL